MGWLPTTRADLIVLTIIKAGEPMSVRQIVEGIDPELWKRVAYQERITSSLRTIGTQDPTDGDRITFDKALRTVTKWLGPYEKYDPPLRNYQNVYMLLNRLQGDRVVYRAGRGDGAKAHRSANLFAVYTAEERAAAVAKERREWRRKLDPDEKLVAAALEHEKATGVKVRFEVEAKYPRATRRLHLEPPGRVAHAFILSQRESWEEALIEVGVVDERWDV